METGIQYMEVKQNVEPAFFKSHTRKFSEILHSGFNKPRSFDFNIKTHAVFMARLLDYAPPPLVMLNIEVITSPFYFLVIISNNCQFFSLKL